MTLQSGWYNERDYPFRGDGGMSQTLTLPGDIYRKLVQGAAEHGMTVESLLAAVSEMVTPPKTATEEDRRRSARIERLVERFRRGRFSADDRAELNQLIDADYQAATARADRLIRAKQRRTRSGNGKPSRS
jgi:hypothetical protein